MKRIHKIEVIRHNDKELFESLITVKVIAMEDKGYELELQYSSANDLSGNVEYSCMIIARQ